MMEEGFSKAVSPLFYFKQILKSPKYISWNYEFNVHISFKVENRVYSKLFKIMEGYRGDYYAQKLIFGLRIYFLP